MKTDKDIRDDEIRIIGAKPIPQKGITFKRLVKIFVISIAVLGLLLWFLYSHLMDIQYIYYKWMVDKNSHIYELKSQEPQQSNKDIPAVDIEESYIEIRDETVNDVPLYVYVPHNAQMSLSIGLPDKQDTSIIFVAQAADIRQDNGQIVGAFVLAGEPQAWNKPDAKTGYCAVIDGEITIGVAEDSPLFERAIERDGYFFRQYPLVNNGQLIENKPKNKAIRRAIGERRGEIMMVESRSPESFHDFAQALMDLGFKNAIYLVGSSAYGWAVDKDNKYIEFGVQNPKQPQNTNYIVWRRR